MVRFTCDGCGRELTREETRFIAKIEVYASAERIEITPRRHTQRPPGKYKPFEPAEDLVPEMVHAGEGYRFHMTGLTHDERGYPSMTPETQDKLLRRLQDKLKTVPRLYKSEHLDGADVVVVSYGITSRVAQRAEELARAKGLKVGTFRIITAWPFPDAVIAELARKVKAFVVPELNLGQMSREVQRAANGAAITRWIDVVGEMEALCAVQIALLTIYDMCKAVDRGMVIESVRLLEKSGGRSGHWKAGG